MPDQFLQFPRRNRFAVGPLSRGRTYVRNASAKVAQPAPSMPVDTTASSALLSPAPASGTAPAQTGMPILPNGPDPRTELFLNIGAVTITLASPAVLTLTAHGQPNDKEVYLQTTGSLPTGLVQNTRYFIVNATTNTFQLAPTVSGSALSTSGTQSGTHTLYAKS